MGIHGQAKHRTREEETDAVFSFCEGALWNPNLDSEALESLAEQIIATFDDQRQARGIQLLIQTTIRQATLSTAKRIEPERRIPLVEAAKILGLSADFLRLEVGDGNIECCPRAEPVAGKKGARGGRIYFLQAHLDRYSGKRI